MQPNFHHHHASDTMMSMDVMSAHSETDDPNGEGEGVWSPEIEQAFQEALKLFPPCGRRKHILQEEGGGKMYGRNELIARYIEQKTGHRRTRKQVSSHIQVLSRREARSKASSRGGDTDSVSPASSITASSIGGTDRILSRPDSATSGHGGVGITSANGNGITNGNGYNNGSLGVSPMELSNGHHHLNHHQNHIGHHHHHHNFSHHHHQHLANQLAATQHQVSNITAAAAAISLNPYDFWEDRPIMTRKIRLVEFSAFIEQRNTKATTPSSTLSQAAVLASLATSSGPYPTNPPHQLTNQNFYQQTASSHPASSATAHDLYSSTTGGVHRHSYVKIDYRQPSERQANKIERIDVGEIKDKFPEKLFHQGSSDSFFLVKFWADLDYDADYCSYEDQNSYFGFSSQFETVVPYKDITCSTKVCSYGKQVLEKVDKVYGTFDGSNSTYSYMIDRSPMCEFMIQFIKKLRQLPELLLMNRILENFTVLQQVKSESTSEVLLCIAYVFEIAPIRPQPTPAGSQYHVYKLCGIEQLLDQQLQQQQSPRP